MRLFIALNIAGPLREAMYAATAPLRAAAPGAAWVRGDNLHVTLKFLGEVAEDSAEPLREALAAAARRSAPLRLELGGVGAFPNLRAPRIVWMAASPDSRLELLYHDVETVCHRLGYELDGRAFRPHITLARVRGRMPRAEARALAAAGRAVRWSARAEVDTLDLMRSTLAPGGSRYELLHAAPLGER